MDGASHGQRRIELDRQGAPVDPSGVNRNASTCGAPPVRLNDDFPVGGDVLHVSGLQGTTVFAASSGSGRATAASATTTAET
jgi:hypothetical protein